MKWRILKLFLFLYQQSPIPALKKAFKSKEKRMESISIAPISAFHEMNQVQNLPLEGLVTIVMIERSTLLECLLKAPASASVLSEGWHESRLHSGSRNHFTLNPSWGGRIVSSEILQQV